MRIVNISQARSSLADLINLVTYSSETVVIQKMGKPVAALVNINTADIVKQSPKMGIPPSHSAGTIALPRNTSLKRVFAALKEPYDTTSLLGR